MSVHSSAHKSSFNDEQLDELRRKVEEMQRTNQSLEQEKHQLGVDLEATENNLDLMKSTIENLNSELAAFRYQTQK